MKFQVFPVIVKLLSISVRLFKVIVNFWRRYDASKKLGTQQGCGKAT